MKQEEAKRVICLVDAVIEFQRRIEIGASTSDLQNIVKQDEGFRVGRVSVVIWNGDYIVGDGCTVKVRPDYYVINGLYFKPDGISISAEEAHSG